MTVILGQTFALITALCWAQNSIVYSMAGRRVSSQTVTHIRLWIALPAVLIVHLIITGVLIPSGIPVSSFIYLAASGLIGFFLADIFIFHGFVALGPRETMVIMTLSPILAALLSWLFQGETLALQQIAGVLLTIGGVMWVIYAERQPKKDGNKDYQKGITVALLGAAAQAGAMVLSKQGLTEGVHPVSANIIRVTFGLAGLAVFMISRKRFVSDFRKMGDRKAFLLIGAGALVGPVLGIILALYALTMAPVGIVTTLMQTSPVMLLPVDKFLFKRKIPWSVWIGTVIAVAGTALLFIKV
ncbi:MAG: DMT family transporter [Spirochaetia bacterium]